MTVVTTYGNDDDAGRAAEFQGATLETWEWDLVEATDEERALMREHGILPEEHTLWVEDEKGERHAAHLEFAPTLLWSRYGAATAQTLDEFEGCRIVAASAADVALLRRFGFLAVTGPDQTEDELERDEKLKRAA